MIPHRVSAVLLFFFFGGVQVSGQLTRPGQVPKDSAALYTAFFYFQNALHDAIQQADQEDPDQAHLLRTGAGVKFSLTVEDLRQLGDIASDFVTAKKALREPSGSTIAATAVSRAVEEERLVSDAVKALQDRLSADGLGSVQAYINGEFRSRIKGFKVLQ